jgi:hypothetical protein
MIDAKSLKNLYPRLVKIYFDQLGKNQCQSDNIRWLSVYFRYKSVIKAISPFPRKFDRHYFLNSVKAQILAMLTDTLIVRARLT